MMYARNPLRPGMTAIAAVLALSSTQLFAQSADTPAADTSTPVLVTPPPVTVTPDAPAITSAPASVTAAAPTTTMQTVSTPVVHMPDSAADSPDAAPAKATRHAKAVSKVEAPIPATVAAAPAAPAPATAEKANVASKTVTTEKSQVAPVAAAPVAAAQTQPVTQTASSDDVLPIAGIAGVGVLALAGGFALARRRKPEEEVYEAPMMPETATAAPYEPVFVPEEPVYAMAEAPELIDAPRTEVPAGFDMSRFGRHTQAAYRGPTADNPSLSLKNRLKRASFFDQRERMAGMTAAPQAEMPAPAMAATARRTEHADHIVSRLRPQKQPTFKPVFQN